MKRKPASSLTSLAAVLFLWLSSGTIALAEKRVALVIGNSAYEYAAKLANPANDAAGIAAALKRLGFEIIEGRDLNKTATEKSIRAFQKTLDGADVALFFYAGHGLQVAGQNYIAPVDAMLNGESDLDFETVPVDLVLKQMERGTRTNLVFLDACRDNPLAQNLARSMGTRSGAVGRGLARVGAGLGTLVAFATQPGNVALDGSGSHSPFTAALLKHIERPGIDVTELLIEVRREVLAATGGKQVPWDQSSLTGKFHFAPQHDAGSIGNGNTTAAEPVAADYQLAERVGTREAWQAFLARHGNSKDNFHVQLAQAALQKLAVGIPPDQRQPSVEPAEEVLPPPLSDPSRCRAANFAGIGARVCASSVLKPHQNIDYDPGNLSDDRPDTAWVEGGKDNGEGQYLVLAFDAPLLIRELTLANGYGKNDDLFAKNGRVERLDIVFSSGERRSVKLSDTPSWQSVAIDPPVKARWLQLIIGSVYSGWKYSDTAVSGLKLTAERAN